MPVLQQTLDTVDLDALENHKNELESRLQAIERDEDIAGLATAREREQWTKIERIEKVLASADQSDPLVQEMREKTRLLRGRLLWDFNASYKARLWRTRKELRELDVAYKEARRRWVLVERAREDYPARTEEFAGRVANLQPRIGALSAQARSGRTVAEPLSGRDRGQGTRIAEGASRGVLAAGALRAGLDLRSRVERQRYQQRAARNERPQCTVPPHPDRGARLHRCARCRRRVGCREEAGSEARAHDQGSREPRSPGLARSAERREAAAGDRAVPPASWSCSRRTRRCAPKRCAASAICRSRSTKPRAPRAWTPASKAWS